MIDCTDKFSVSLLSIIKLKFHKIPSCLKKIFNELEIFGYRREVTLKVLLALTNKCDKCVSCNDRNLRNGALFNHYTNTIISPLGADKYY